MSSVPPQSSQRHLVKSTFRIYQNTQYVWTSNYNSQDTSRHGLVADERASAATPLPGRPVARQCCAAESIVRLRGAGLDVVRDAPCMFTPRSAACFRRVSVAAGRAGEQLPDAAAGFRGTRTHVNFAAGARLVRLRGADDAGAARHLSFLCFLRFGVACGSAFCALRELG